MCTSVIFFLCLLLCSLSVSAQSNAASSQANKKLNKHAYKTSLADISTKRYVDGEELLFSIVLDKFSLGDVNVLVQDGLYYIHLEEFINVADFVIRSEKNAERIQYSGWWSKEENVFSLAYPADDELASNSPNEFIASVGLKGRLQGLGQSELIELASDIYIRADILSDWFAASFSFEESKLWLNVTTTQAWPFQLSQQRKKAKTNRVGAIPDASMAHYDTGYGLTSPQAIDLVTSFRGSRIQSDNSLYSANYNLLGRQDLLGVSTRFYVAGSDMDILNAGTIDLSRHWAGENKGPLGITSLQFGDIQAVRTSVSSLSASRGISVSNAPLDRKTNQELSNISGLVQAGWDVELYQNKVLVQQLFDVQSGRYEFLDLPLFTGLNEFKVVKYGPQGQIEEEVFERLFDSSLGNNVNSIYQLSLTQNNTDALNIRDYNNEIDDSFVLSGRYSFNFGRDGSVDFAHKNALGSSLENDIYFASINSKLGNKTILRSAYTYTNDTSHELALNANSNLWNQSINLGINISKTELENLANDYASGFQINASGKLYSTTNQSLYHQSDFSYSNSFNEQTSISATNRLAYRMKGIGINHSYTYSKTEDAFGNSERFDIGVLNSSFNIANVSTRFGASYSYIDEFSWENAFVNANWYMFNALSLRAEYSRNLRTDLNNYGLSLDWKDKLYGLNARIDHSDEFDTSITLSARISFSEAPTEFGYIQSKRSLAEYGTVLVRVFHDLNNNQIYDADDIAIKGAKVSAIQSRRHEKTDVIGIAQLDGMSAFRKTDLELDLSTADTPFLVQSTHSTSITPRPGLVTLINYPLVEGGEFEGEISYVDQYQRIRPLAKVPLIISDKRGNVVDKLNASFDGYYYYNGLVPHQYYLGVDKDYLENNNFLPFTPILLNISEQGQALYDVNIVLEKKKMLAGYIVTSGEFSSSSLLISYHALLFNNINKLRPNFTNQLTPFEHQIANGKHSLGLLFTLNKTEADDICAFLQSVTKDCKVSDHSHFLNKPL